MSFSIVQKSTSVAVAAASTVGKTFANNNTAGNLLVAFAGAVGSATPTISDPNGNTWIGPVISAVAAGNYAAIFYCLSCHASSSPVTVTLANAGSKSALALIEYAPTSGSVFDTSNVGTGVTSVQLSLNPSSANDVICAMIILVTGGQSLTPLSGTTIEITDISLFYQVADAFPVSAGAFTIGSSTAATFAMAALAIGPSGSSPYFNLFQASGFAKTASANVSQSFSLNNGSGNLLVAFVSSTTGIPTISDTQGNTWFLGVTSPLEINYSSVFYCLSSIAGPNTVSIANGGTSTALGLIEYLTLGPSAFDAVATSISSGSLINPGVVINNASASNGLCCGMLNSPTGGALLTPATNCIVELGSGTPTQAIDALPTVAPFSFGGTFPQAVDWNLAVVAFKPSPVFTISGNAGAGGVNVNYSGQISGTVSSDSLANYSVPGLLPGSYTISPLSPFYSFSPLSQNVTITSANVSGINFAATQTSTSRSGSGSVTFLNQPLPGVTVTWDGPTSGQATTDSYGQWATGSDLFTGLYHIVPTLAGYTFAPPQIFAIVTQNILEINFIGTSFITSGIFPPPEMHLDYSGTPGVAQAAINNPDNKIGGNTVPTLNQNLSLLSAPSDTQGRPGEVRGRFDQFNVINNPA